MAEQHDLIKISEFIEKLTPSGSEYIPIGEGQNTFKVKASTIISLMIGANIDDNLHSLSASRTLSARQGKILNDLVQGLSIEIDGIISHAGTGVVGEASPSTIPINNGFGIYTVSTPGTYTNFKTSGGLSIDVTQSELNSGLVQLWGNNNVWKKHITLVEPTVYAPIFNNNISII